MTGIHSGYGPLAQPYWPNSARVLYANTTQVALFAAPTPGVDDVANDSHATVDTRSGCPHLKACSLMSYVQYIGAGLARQ